MHAMQGMMTTPRALVPDTMSATKKPEITGPCPELARLVLAITGDVTRRQAENHVGGAVSHQAIARMWAGERVNEGTILRFAQGYGVDPNPLLAAAGYSPLPTNTNPVPSLEPGDSKTVQPKGIERIPIFPLPEGYQDLDDPIVQAAEAGAREAAEKAYQTTFKSIAEALRHARRISPGTVVGPVREDDEK